MGDLQLRVVDISIRVRQLEELVYAIKSKSFVVGSSVFDIPDVSKLEDKRKQLKTELKVAIEELLTLVEALP